MNRLAIGAALLASSLWTGSTAYAAIPAIPLPSTTPLTIASSVTAAATPGLLHYSYTITNSALWTVNGLSYPSPLVSFAVPYFDDGGITHITAPVGWDFSISDYNTFNLPSAKTLSWFGTTRVSGPPCDDPLNGNPNCIASAIQPGASVGFGFDAPLAAAKAPYDSGFYFVVLPYSFYDRGDPPIPASPLALAAGLQPVPEPATAALWLLGLAALAVGARRPR